MTKNNILLHIVAKTIMIQYSTCIMIFEIIMEMLIKM